MVVEKTQPSEQEVLGSLLSSIQGMELHLTINLPDSAVALSLDLLVCFLRSSKMDPFLILDLTIV